VEKPLRPDHLRQQRLVLLNAGYWFRHGVYAPSVSYVYDGPLRLQWMDARSGNVGVQEQLARAVTTTDRSMVFLGNDPRGHRSFPG